MHVVRLARTSTLSRGTLQRHPRFVKQFSSELTNVVDSLLREYDEGPLLNDNAREIVAELFGV